MLTPSVGRIVHFQSGGECRTSTILDVFTVGPIAPDGCLLRLFLSDGQVAEVLCEHDERKAENSWHWPATFGTGRCELPAPVGITALGNVDPASSAGNRVRP